MSGPQENEHTESEDATGYRESPDTADMPTEQVEVAAEEGDPGAVLTTDDEAQRDDGPLRPGNTSS